MWNAVSSTGLHMHSLNCYCFQPSNTPRKKPSIINTCEAQVLSASLYCYIVSGFGGLWALLHSVIGQNPAPRLAKIGMQHKGPSVACGHKQVPFLHQDARLDTEKYLVSTEFRIGPTGGKPLRSALPSYLLPLSAPATCSSHLLSPILGACISILGLAPSFRPSVSQLLQLCQCKANFICSYFCHLSSPLTPQFWPQ